MFYEYRVFVQSVSDVRTRRNQTQCLLSGVQKAETIELLFVLIVSVQDDRFIKLKTIHLGLFYSLLWSLQGKEDDSERYHLPLTVYLVYLASPDLDFQTVFNQTIKPNVSIVNFKFIVVCQPGGPELYQMLRLCLSWLLELGVIGAANILWGPCINITRWLSPNSSVLTF